MKKIKKSPFTLIELLAVIGIVVLLVGIFAPAFSRMMVGNKVEQMASGFKTGLEVAQANAIASRRYVAVVLPGDYSKIGNNQLRAFCYGGYRLAYVKKDGTKWKFTGWVPGSAWSNMADGAMLLEVKRENDWYVTAYDRTSGLKDTPFASAPAVNDLFPGANGFIEFAFEEASANTPIDADLAGIGKENCRAIIFSPFGGCINGETPYLFFFTEGRIEENNQIRLTNTDNFMVLKLNPITGKVVFLADEEE